MAILPSVGGVPRGLCYTENMTESFAEANREHKDSVFTAFFREDTSRLIELYNAIADKNYPPNTKIEVNTLENILSMGRMNDISFSLDDKLIILMEHQSTIIRTCPCGFCGRAAPYSTSPPPA
jgi:hypothetical protein